MDKTAHLLKHTREGSRGVCASREAEDADLVTMRI